MMVMQQPWQLVRVKDSPTAVIFVQGTAAVIAEVYDRGDEDDSARLIVAAPKLLAALEEMRKQLRKHVKLDVKRHYSLMVADAAAGTIIAEARGDA